MPMKLIIYILGFIALTLSSCEEILKDQWNADFKPEIVVEAILIEGDSIFTVHVFETSAISDTLAPKTIDNAKISISEDDKLPVYLSFDKLGSYYAPFKAHSEHTYKLSFVINDKEYTATAKMPFNPIIDSIQISNRFNSGSNKTEYFANIHIKKIEGKTIHYFLMNGYTNGIALTRTAIFNDLYSKRIAINYTYPFSKGDTAKFDLYSLNYDAYNFYTCLLTFQNLNGLMFPENLKKDVPSNFSGNIRGFFQVSAKTEITQVIK